MADDADVQPDAKRPKADVDEDGAQVELFSYWRSSCSWRVRIGLEMKGIKYKYSAIHLVEGKQKSDEYVRVNPMKQVPALRIDGALLTQSVAILEYLEERNPEPALLPKEPTKRAVVRALVESINSGIQPLQNFAVLGKVEAIGGSKLEWAHDMIDAGFEALERSLERVPGRTEQDKYCVGDTVTLADLALVPQVYNANRFNVDMTKFPIISKVEANLRELEPFMRAHPDVQPDAAAI